MSDTLGDNLAWPSAFISLASVAIAWILRQWAWERKAKRGGEEKIADRLFEQQSKLWDERGKETESLRYRLDESEKLSLARLVQVQKLSQEIREKQTALNRRIDEVSAINEILAAQVARLQRRVSSLERQLRDLGHEPEPEQK